ncbi:MAG TPA: histidine phosphatase family protein [Capsulimonadaceae bacterium]|nr:histidine phosphatase family protein [Capsulimonadaceae bacterium]
MHLYLARHGETVWNIERRIQGWGDSPLTQIGLRQAEALADRLSHVPLNAVYASDLGRARQTAEIVARRHSLTITALPAFREMSWGEWEGMTSEEMQSSYPDQWAAFVKKGRDELHEGETDWESTTHIPGGETIAQTARRFYAGLEEIVARHTAEKYCVLIVGHGGSLRLAITHALRLRPVAHRRFYLDNTGLSRIDYGIGMPPRIHFINDTVHWQEEAPDNGQEKSK